jgi:hypothetical protein
MNYDHRDYVRRVRKMLALAEEEHNQEYEGDLALDGGPVKFRLTGNAFYQQEYDQCWLEYRAVWTDGKSDADQWVTVDSLFGTKHFGMGAGLDFRYSLNDIRAGL